MDRPNYYAVIPGEVRYDKDLRPNEKLLFAEITALATKEGFCWATNSYFAGLFGVSTRVITTWISHLKKKGYIKVNTTRNENRVLERKIFVGMELNFQGYGIKVPGGTEQKFQGGIEQNFQGGTEQKFQENNTVMNNTNINNTKNNRVVSPPSLEDVKAYVKEKRLNVDPQKFFDYYEEGDWHDAKGNKVRNWKQKLITWDKHTEKPKEQDYKDIGVVRE